MTQEFSLRLLPQEAADEQSVRAFLVREKGLAPSDITAIRVLKRGIDARHRTVFVNLSVRVYLHEQPVEEDFQSVDYPIVDGRPQVIVVGAGPGGLFAALRLIELAFPPSSNLNP